MSAAPQLVSSERNASVLSERQFARLRMLVESQLGIRMPLEKRSMLQARLARRYREAGQPSVDAYCEYLFGPTGDSERERFLDLVTTNFTQLFREPQQLDALTQGPLDALVLAAHASGHAFRCWSAACSSGEEVWTLGMMLDLAHERHGIHTPFEVLGTDVSRRMLERARRAVYPEPSLESVPEALRARYWQRSRNRSDARVRVAHALRDRATFQHLNLMDAAYAVPRNHDLVFLRNVLIYFDRKEQTDIVRRVTTHLRTGGLLCLGTAESVHGADLPLCHVGRSIYRKEPGG